MTEPEARNFDCIVIGVGGIGSAAVYELAKRGVNVVGLEQFEIGHDQGSSHGDTRAIRLVYFEHPDYVPLLKRAFELWDELEAEWGKPLLARTGILQGGPADGEVLKGLLNAAAEHNLPMAELDAGGVSRRFDGFAISDADSAIFDPNGGILKVEECVTAFVRLGEKHGATIHTGTKIEHWFRRGTGRRGQWQVETDRGTFTAEKLIITPGAWAGRMLPEFSPHLQVLKKSLFWFDPEDDCYLIENGCPVFLFERQGRTFYGFPAIDEKGIKIAEHSGGYPIESPAALDRHIDTADLESVTLALRHHLPRAGHQLNHHTTCMYTVSTDGHFIVGQYPSMDDVYIVIGLSGHGYKFASVLGEIMADLAIDGKTTHPINFLSPARFL